MGVSDYDRCAHCSRPRWEHRVTEFSTTKTGFCAKNRYRGLAFETSKEAYIRRLNGREVLPHVKLLEQLLDWDTPTAHVLGDALHQQGAYTLASILLDADVSYGAGASVSDSQIIYAHLWDLGVLCGIITRFQVELFAEWLSRSSFHHKVSVSKFGLRSATAAIKEEVGPDTDPRYDLSDMLDDL